MAEQWFEKNANIKCKIDLEEGGLPPNFEEKRPYYHLHPFFQIAWDAEGEGKNQSYDDSTVQFSAMFGSCNLLRAATAKFSTEMAFQEDILIGLKPDPSEDGKNLPSKSSFAEWFSFAITNVDVSKAYKFHVYPVNRKSMQRMRPLMSNLDAEDPEWQRIGIDCECVALGDSLWTSYASTAGYDGFEAAYVYTFTINFPAETVSPEDTLILSLNQPYGKLHLECGLLSPLEKSPHARLSQLVQGDDRFPLVVVTEDKNESKSKGVKKPLIVIMARLKAADVSSSYAINGFLLHLAFDNSLEMRSLRQRFCFYVCPMMNPQGAYAGLSRSDCDGHNLRQCWKHPSREKHPQVYYLKKLLRRSHKAHRLLAFIELAGSATASSAMYLEGVEEVVSTQRTARLEASSKNEHHPCSNLPIPSPWSFVYQLMKRLKDFRHDRCRFVSHSFAKHARVQAAHHAASSLTHHPVHFTLKLCSAVHSTGDINRRVGPTGARYQCLSARHWFAVGEVLLSALHDVYFDSADDQNKPSAISISTSASAMAESPHPYMDKKSKHVSGMSERDNIDYFNSAAYRTVILALTSGQGMLLDRHRSTVIQRAFQHFHPHGEMVRDDEDEGDTEDDDSVASMSSDDSLYSDDSAMAAAAAAADIESPSSSLAEKEQELGNLLESSSDDEEEDDRDNGDERDGGGGGSKEKKILGAKIQIGTAHGRYLDDEEARTLRLKQQADKDDKDSLSARFMRLRDGPVKKRVDEEYRVLDETFASIIARYTLKGKAAKDCGSSMKGKFPDFNELIRRDEERWLASHFPRKDRVGKSTKLDEQLGAIFGATGALDRDKVGMPLSPPTIGAVGGFNTPFQDSSESVHGRFSPISLSINRVSSTTRSSTRELTASWPNLPPTAGVAAPLVVHVGEEDDDDGRGYAPPSIIEQASSVDSPPSFIAASSKETSASLWHYTDSLDSNNHLDLPLLYSMDTLTISKTNQDLSFPKQQQQREEIRIDSPRVARIFGERDEWSEDQLTLSTATPPRASQSSRVPNSILKTLRRKYTRQANQKVTI